MDKIIYDLLTSKGDADNIFSLITLAEQGEFITESANYALKLVKSSENILIVSVCGKGFEEKSIRIYRNKKSVDKNQVLFPESDIVNYQLYKKLSKVLKTNGVDELYIE